MKSGSNRTRKKNRVKKGTKRATRDTRWLNYQTFITKLDFGDSRYSDSFPSRICTHCKVSCYSAFYVSDKVTYFSILPLAIFFHAKLLLVSFSF